MINKKLILLALCTSVYLNAQENWDQQIDAKFIEVLDTHREFVSIPNIPMDVQDMFSNISWVKNKYEKVGFQLKTLESSTLPVLFAEKLISSEFKTILFYFHLDGQAVDPASWDQKDPFVPVLKKKGMSGKWEEISWSELQENVDDEWRIYGRSAADDKGPILMFLSAMELLQKQQIKPSFNIKIIFDLEEEYGSNGFLSTLKKYKNKYQSDYMIIMDGPAHSSNQPTLTFGCRGIASCSITTYGSKLPQHSGHYGNYVSNPVFGLSRLLSSM